MMAPAPGVLDAHFVDAIRTAATGYTKWGRVDETPNVAPAMCAAPLPQHHGTKGAVRMSEADDAPHGKKLYYLWANDRDAYLDLRVATGFAIVKESFVARPSSAPTVERGAAQPLHDRIEVDGHWLTTGEAKALFVMTKISGAGTDGGWIYGTIAPDGAVTSAGRVASCMGCHEGAPHGRLFGLKTKR